ncbi:MAG: site-specific DNA-methyltransferase [Ktedonobacteraceae bacterium]
MAELIWKGKHNPYTYQAPPLAPVLHTSAWSPEASKYTPADWHNRLIYGDKQVVLPALLPEFAGRVNLIYIDPPFMTGHNFTSGSQFAYSDCWHNDLDSYLQWLYETLLLLHRLLAQNGSLYLHLDWRTTHYARAILDEIFALSPQAEGAGFKNEIIWHYQSGGRNRKSFARKHDSILLYTRSAQYCFHGERIAERRGTQRRNHMRKQVDADGRTTWTIRSAGRIYTYDEDTLLTPSDVWSDISHLHQKDPERNSYATQKPEALLERIILASSEEQDIVLDCFCGSGVTPAVAEHLGRRWIACDQGELAIQLTRTRLLAKTGIRPFIVQTVAS